ncbi:MAG: NAD-dependent epimerase/dehydratase family protein, partial [Bacteroidales bacterium]|nr:NAD-dependent epimerase/dehydratase family protein [Bacteroidales bacterium]
MERIIENKKVLVTGGAGFIGSNICEKLLTQNNEVVCLDNFATGKRENIKPFLPNSDFTLVEGDIRNIEDCNEAVQGAEVVLHQAALGSVPRSIGDPITSNEVNVSGFLNMLVAARDNGVKRFVYAASSSTYGDSTNLPKVEDVIGKPLSPYAITKYVNELYADVFARLYDMQIIGLRYFNVFGRRQDPDGAYAAVIPKFVKSLIRYESPVINGDGSYSRDFTYIDNVIQANEKAATVDSTDAINTVYNVAYGERTTLNELVTYLQEYLSEFDSEIAKVEI